MVAVYCDAKCCKWHQEGKCDAAVVTIVNKEFDINLSDTVNEQCCIAYEYNKEWRNIK